LLILGVSRSSLDQCNELRKQQKTVTSMDAMQRITPKQSTPTSEAINMDDVT